MIFHSISLYPLNLSLFLCTQWHTHAHTYAHQHTWRMYAHTTHTHSHMHTYTPTHTHTHLLIHAHTHIHTHNAYTHTHVHTHSHIHAHAHSSMDDNNSTCSGDCHHCGCTLQQMMCCSFSIPRLSVPVCKSIRIIVMFERQPYYIYIYHFTKIIILQISIHIKTLWIRVWH